MKQNSAEKQKHTLTVIWTHPNNGEYESDTDHTHQDEQKL